MSNLIRNEYELSAQMKESLDRILGTTWQLWNETQKVNYTEKLCLGRYELRQIKGKEPVGVYASFELHPMINCCGICVSTRAEVAPAHRGKGLGTLLNRLRIETARQLGYGLLLCTDIDANTYQRKILKKNGWRDLHCFLNPRTRNKVFISAINL